MSGDWEIKDDAEIALIVNGNLLGGAKLDGGDVVSVVVIKRGDGESLSTVYEKRFDDRWILRYRRMISPHVTAAIAIVTTASVVNNRPVVRENVLRYDQKDGWRECSDGRREKNRDVR